VVDQRLRQEGHNSSEGRALAIVDAERRTRPARLGEAEGD